MPPFVNDPILRDVVDHVLDAGATQVIETGTHLGFTIRYLAARHADLPMTTIEARPDFFAAARTALKKYRNIEQVLGDSSKVLVKRAARFFNGVPFLFLDAHWEKLPLLDEIRCVARNASDAVILIHDFEVPGRPEFEFDVYGDQIVGLRILCEGLAEAKPYAIYLPNSEYIAEYQRLRGAPDRRRMRGTALVFIGADAVHAKFREFGGAHFSTRWAA